MNITLPSFPTLQEDLWADPETPQPERKPVAKKTAPKLRVVKKITLPPFRRFPDNLWDDPIFVA